MLIEIIKVFLFLINCLLSKFWSYFSPTIILPDTSWVAHRICVHRQFPVHHRGVNLIPFEIYTKIDPPFQNLNILGEHGEHHNP